MGGMTLPYERGQSGTARPDSVDVTRAPATRSRKTQTATVRVPTLRKASRTGLEREGSRLRLLRAHRDLLGLCAELLVPRLDRVSPGGEVLDRVCAVRRGDGKEGMGEDAAVGRHPAVHVALDPNHDLGLVELLRVLHALDRPPEIERLVLLGQRVDVVERVVAVQELDALPGHDAENVWVVRAALLVEGRGRSGRGIGAVDPRFHIDEDVREALILADDNVLAAHVSRMRLGAEGVGRHLELFGGRRGALEGHPARGRGRPRRPRGAVLRGARGAGRLGPVRVVVVLASAPGQERGAHESGGAKGGETKADGGTGHAGLLGGDFLIMSPETRGA